jgi:hypothetical protein
MRIFSEFLHHIYIFLKLIIIAKPARTSESMSHEIGVFRGGSLNIRHV